MSNTQVVYLDLVVLFDLMRNIYIYNACIHIVIFKVSSSGFIQSLITHIYANGLDLQSYTHVWFYRHAEVRSTVDYECRVFTQILRLESQHRFMFARLSNDNPKPHWYEAPMVRNTIGPKHH